MLFAPPCSEWARSDGLQARPMPIYEYRCEGCGRRVSVWVRRVGQEAESCLRCGSARLTRLISHFALARREESRMGRMADDAALSGVDEKDPKSMARWMRRMGQELGEEGGAEFDRADSAPEIL